MFIKRAKKVKSLLPPQFSACLWMTNNCGLSILVLIFLTLLDDRYL